MELTLDLKINLFKEYLDNVGYDKLRDPELIDDLLDVKELPNGKVDPNTLTARVRAAMNAYVGSQLMEPLMSNENISEYQTLLQKEIFFEQITIDNKAEFDEIFEKFINEKQILFRGLNEAKYRLYSSLQRHWINKNLADNFDYSEFLKALISNAKEIENGTIANYLDSTFFDSDNDLAVLSFLQHHRCPTPLLDWTYSFGNALFFATENIKMPEDEWEIDNYFCVYYLEEKFLNENSIKEILKEGFNKYKPKLRERFYKLLKEENIDTEDIKDNLPNELINKLAASFLSKSAMKYMTKVERLVTFPILYFSDHDESYKTNYLLNNNLNIINQEGVFTWNSVPTKPLEHVANAEFREENLDSDYRFSKCININKNLANYVRDKIKELGIRDEFIYPDPYDLAGEIFQKTKNQN